MLTFALFYLGLSVLAGILGRNRVIGFWGFFFLSLLVTPVISLIFLFCSTPKNRQGSKR